MILFGTDPAFTSKWAGGEGGWGVGGEDGYFFYLTKNKMFSIIFRSSLSGIIILMPRKYLIQSDATLQDMFGWQDLVSNDDHDVTAAILDELQLNWQNVFH